MFRIDSFDNNNNTKTDLINIVLIIKHNSDDTRIIGIKINNKKIKINNYSRDQLHNSMYNNLKQSEEQGKKVINN